jgi:thioredoxin 1
MAFIDLNDNDFEKKVLSSKLPVFVDFWAAWCGPCKMASPVLEELSEEYQGKVEFYKVDVDKNKDVPMKFGVRSIPTTILFKSGKEVERQVGFSGKKSFEDLVKKVV